MFSAFIFYLKAKSKWTLILIFAVFMPGYFSCRTYILTWIALTFWFYLEFTLKDSGSQLWSYQCLDLKSRTAWLGIYWPRVRWAALPVWHSGRNPRSLVSHANSSILWGLNARKTRFIWVNYFALYCNLLCVTLFRFTITTTNLMHSVSPKIHPENERKYSIAP